MATTPIKKVGSRQQTVSRIGWLLLLWTCSVAGLGLVALAMRLLMSYAGMTR
ncbi:DUF2474 domain-containing protein [Alcaligenaceae bacterium SJ-26]|nr:DUF2474 domain-containing protein [Alcaligenaceae bacterium SJ-26]